MKTIEIFLASSSELSDNRKDFERFINRMNIDWVQKDVFLKLTIWEDFIDAMSPTRLQDEYNNAAESCDVFLMLFFTKVGKYTEEEFTTASEAFKKKGKPLIYTYFKDDLILSSKISHEILSMLDFKKKLDALGHFYSQYRSIEDLQWQFSRQLEKQFGQTAMDTMEINKSTTQSQIDTIALNLTSQLLSGSEMEINPEKYREAIHKATELPRHTIYLLAEKTRNSSWATNVGMMERSIPIFEALIETDKRKEKHYYYGQLGYALKDKRNPEYERALQCLNQAIEIRGDATEFGWVYYELNRAFCRIAMERKRNENQPSPEAVKKEIVKDLKTAKQGMYDGDFEKIINQPLNRDVKKWVELNKVKL